MTRGRFITFEGIEGSGKSTQLKLLSEWLRSRGFKVEETREPGGTRLGATIRSLLLDPAATGIAFEAELFLYLADRAQNVRERIVPALEGGRVVLCDRHADATLAYQGRMRGLGIPRLVELNSLATGGLKPDRTLLFDLPAGAGLKRVADRRLAAGTGGDRMDDEPLAFHEGVRQAYLDLALQEPERFVIIDAAGPAAAVHQNVVERIGGWLTGD